MNCCEKRGQKKKIASNDRISSTVNIWSLKFLNLSCCHLSTIWQSHIANVDVDVEWLYEWTERQCVSRTTYIAFQFSNKNLICFRSCSVLSRNDVVMDVHPLFYFVQHEQWTRALTPYFRHCFHSFFFHLPVSAFTLRHALCNSPRSIIIIFPCSCRNRCALSISISHLMRTKRHTSEMH